MIRVVETRSILEADHADPIVSLNEESLKAGPRELVRKTVEEMLSGLLEEEAGDLVGAERHGRTAGSGGCRAGRCDGKLATTSGEATISILKLKGVRFTTAIIERHRRRETSAGEAMAEMYLAGVSTGRIEDVSEILWGPGASAATVSNLNERALASVEGRRDRPLDRAYPYACVDGMHLEGSWGGSCENVAVMAAVGADGDGCREAIGAAEGFAESGGAPAGAPLVAQVARAARGPRVHGRQGAGMFGPAAEVLPEAACRRRTARFYRNVLARAPKSKRPRVAAMPKAVHAMESRGASAAKALAVAGEPESVRLGEAAEAVRGGYAETLACTRFPRGHRRRIRANNAIERLNREIRGRTRAVGTFPDGSSALMLVTARLKHVAESEWGSGRYLDATLPGG